MTKPVDLAAFDELSNAAYDETTDLLTGGEKVGRLTSGGWSVAFGRQIGMGYVRPDLAAPGTKLKLRMFRELFDAEVTVDSPYDPENARLRQDG